MLWSDSFPILVNLQFKIKLPKWGFSSNAIEEPFWFSQITFSDHYEKTIFACLKNVILLGQCEPALNTVHGNLSRNTSHHSKMVWRWDNSPWWSHHVTAGSVSSGIRRSRLDMTSTAVSRRLVMVGASPCSFNPDSKPPHYHSTDRKDPVERHTQSTA